MSGACWSWAAQTGAQCCHTGSCSPAPAGEQQADCGSRVTPEADKLKLGAATCACRLGHQVASVRMWQSCHPRGRQAQPGRSDLCPPTMPITGVPMCDDVCLQAEREHIGSRPMAQWPLVLSTGCKSPEPAVWGMCSATELWHAAASPEMQSTAACAAPDTLGRACPGHSGSTQAAAQSLHAIRPFRRARRTRGDCQSDHGLISETPD